MDAPFFNAKVGKLCYAPFNPDYIVKNEIKNYNFSFMKLDPVSLVVNEPSLKEKLMIHFQCETENSQ